MSDKSTFKMSFNESEQFNIICKETNMTYQMGFGQGGKGRILSDTVVGWNAKASLISEKNVIYVYTDYIKEIDEHGEEYFIPGLKIGDGKAYLIDLPFTDEYMIKHIQNTVVHITQAEREFWNNKVSVYLDADDQENIVFTTD